MDPSPHLRDLRLRLAEGEGPIATVRVDVRRLEPPEPLVRILATLESLDADQRLIASLDREPLLLFPHLTDRGWAYEGASQADGSFVITIYRPR
jgi:hypothetical protein